MKGGVKISIRSSASELQSVLACKQAAHMSTDVVIIVIVVIIIIVVEEQTRDAKTKQSKSGASRVHWQNTYTE